MRSAVLSAAEHVELAILVVALGALVGVVLIFAACSLFFRFIQG